MFFIGLESGQYDADNIKWSRVSEPEYQELVSKYTKSQNSLRVKISEGLKVVTFALFSLSLVSGLISVTLWVARAGDISSLHAAIMLLVAAFVMLGISKLPLLTKANKRLAGAKNALASVVMTVPSDVISAARVHCDTYQKTDLLETLEASGLDTDSYTERCVGHEPSRDWLMLNWLQTHQLAFYHLLVDLQEEIYRTNFPNTEVCEKSRADIIAESIQRIDNMHAVTLSRSRPK